MKLLHWVLVGGATAVAGYSASRVFLPADRPESEQVGGGPSDADQLGTIRLVITNHQAMQVAGAHDVKRSNCFNRPVRVKDGKPQVLVNKETQEWVDYTDNDPTFVRPNDIDVEIYCIKDGAWVNAAKVYHDLQHLWNRPSINGDEVCFSNVRPGMYYLVAMTTFQKDRTEIVPAPIWSPPRPGWPPSAHESSFLDTVYRKGYWRGRIGGDQNGLYEIVDINPVVDDKSYEVRAELTKRYTYHYVDWTCTMVSPGENPDKALIMLCTDPEFTFPSLRKQAIDDLVSEGAQFALGEVGGWFGEKVLGKQLASRVAVTGASSIILTWAFDPEKWGTVDMGAGLGTDLMALGLGPHGAFGVFAFRAAAQYAIYRIKSDFVKELADPDDLVLTRVLNETTGNTTLTVENYGVPLYNVRLRQKRRPSGNSGRTAKVLPPGKTETFTWSPPDYSTTPELVELELAFEVCPIPGTEYTFTRPVSLFTKKIAPDDDVHLGKGLRIVSFSTTPLSEAAPEMRQVVAEVQNVGDKPAPLALYVKDSDYAGTLVQRRRAAGVHGPYYLGLEQKDPSEAKWRHARGYRWAPRERVSEDKLLAEPPEALIAPGQTRSFGEMTTAGRAAALTWRAFLLDPARGRIDERLLKP